MKKEHQNNVKIQVAYVKEDVETTQEYAQEREKEAGDCSSYLDRDWTKPMLEGDIYNRALVLISISRVSSSSSIDDEKMKLYMYESGTSCDDNDDDVSR
eukprot:14518880-Ditylum_brightwellii.AAC.1